MTKLDKNILENLNFEFAYDNISNNWFLIDIKDKKYRFYSKINRSNELFSEFFERLKNSGAKL